MRVSRAWPHQALCQMRDGHPALTFSHVAWAHRLPPHSCFQKLRTKLLQGGQAPGPSLIWGLPVFRGGLCSCIHPGIACQEPWRKKIS